MKTVRGLENFNEEKASIVTIGSFDGVHVGHRKIISNLVKQAKKEDLISAVLIFFPHPRMVLQNESDIKLIDTLEEKQRKFEELGIDVLIVHPFSKEFAQKSAFEFTQEIIVNLLRIKKIIIGYDYRFGRNREASIDDLKEYSKQFYFEVEEITAQSINEERVSSSKIRVALSEGDVETVNDYLGSLFQFTGKIVEGDKIGKTMGFPTANFEIEEAYKILPKNGVYFVKSLINNQLVFGMMNIGFRPTLKGKDRTIEVNYFDFNENLYHKKISVFILKKIRDEQRFDSLEDLKNQLEIDRGKCLLLMQ